MLRRRRGKSGKDGREIYMIDTHTPGENAGRWPVHHSSAGCSSRQGSCSDLTEAFRTFYETERRSC